MGGVNGSYGGKYERSRRFMENNSEWEVEEEISYWMMISQHRMAQYIKPSVTVVLWG